MRRILLAIVLVAAVALWFWPYVGVYGLARAAASGDPSALAAHIDRPALTRSLARQIMTAYLERSDREHRRRPLEQGLMTAVGASVATPYLDDLLASGTLARLISEGRIGRITVGGRTLVFERTLPTIRSIDARTAFAVLLHSSYETPTSFRLSLPDPNSAEQDYGLHFRLLGLSWRLSGIDLPPEVVDRIVTDAIASGKAPGQSG